MQICRKTCRLPILSSLCWVFLKRHEIKMTLMTHFFERILPGESMQWMFYAAASKCAYPVVVFSCHFCALSLLTGSLAYSMWPSVKGPLCSKGRNVESHWMPCCWASKKKWKKKYACCPWMLYSETLTQLDTCLCIGVCLSYGDYC